MTIPKDLSDSDIRTLVGGKIERAYLLRVSNPELDPTVKFCRLYPERDSGEFTVLDSIELEPGELTIFEVKKDDADSLLTTRRLVWRNEFGTIQDVRLSNISKCGLLASAGDPVYPSDFIHYFKDGKLYEGYPPANLNLRECIPQFKNPYMYLVDTNGHRHVIKLVEMFPVYAVLDAVGSASTEVNQQKWRHYHGID